MDLVRETTSEAGSTLAHTIDLPHVFQEMSHLLRRVVSYDELLVVLVDDGGGEPRISYQSGVDQPEAAIETRFAESWRAAIDAGVTSTEELEEGIQLTLPMAGASGVLGAMTVVAEAPDSPQRREEIERALATIAAQTAAAIERARVVERTQEKRRLEAMGEVAAGIAHELRNPLFGISSAVQLLRFRSQDDPVVERNVGRILREVERLNGMVSDLLEYGRPRPVALAPGDPDAVWDYILEGNRGLLERKSLELVRSREGHTTARIDAERLGQVFLNVLVNACEAAPDGSVVALHSRAGPRGGWRCTLHNGGAPIPAEDIGRVFDLFFSTKPGGTGIGLALCKRIMEEHGGRITVESGSDTGTTVTITLPAS